MLAIVLGAFPGAAEAKDLAGNLPLHHLVKNKALSKDLLQGFLDSCGVERACVARSRSLDLWAALSRCLLSLLDVGALLTQRGRWIETRLRRRAYADTPNKLGRVPLRELVTSSSFSDQRTHAEVSTLDARPVARLLTGRAGAPSCGQTCA
jgi:hypothetical protein